ncbi:50S ribosomal protein L24 [Engelhardtia mirabilis]|uniref:Large ribosomal subunit protein uL24 n=1 Tax=Engelhardtia mirabilis TaxID=2528011 RepID=A0A518BPD4_9BACT|nr:50S ribosomal protein L24 [Planctomycetes bacterium Pla133]QDV03155.1 50S ribosomal protein L24 [Planctomycetes bacterium Pla86]
MKFKRGDKVVVIAGNNKGANGEILLVDRENGRVIVDGVNLRWKHRKSTDPQNPKGERVQEACSVHASNVMLLDPSTGKGTRKRPSSEG